MSDSTDTTRYLYTVEYTEEAERKRVEYLFNNWDDGQIESPQGLVRIAEAVDHDELYQQLVSKVPADQISVHRLEAAATDIESETVTIEQKISASPDAVETFLEYILSKKKAVLQSPSHNEYEIYTKKGRAELSYELTEIDTGLVEARLRITGIPPAPAFLAEFFETELSDYAASQSD
jgi:hypothetical protein